MSRGEGGGRPLTVLDEEQKVQVEALAAYLTTEQVADYLGIGRTTFYEVMKRDPDVSERYQRGRAKAIANIAQKSIIQQAIEGNVTAGIFYLKTQAGWKESDKEAEEGAAPQKVQIEVVDASKSATVEVSQPDN